MKKWAFIFGGGFIAVLIAVGCLLVAFGFGYWDFTNQAHKYENGIQARYKDNQNIYDNGVKKVMETFQVTDAAANKVKEITIAAIQGRYGENGAQAVFQTLQEDNPRLDTSMYKDVQNIIVQFRDEFKQNQTELVSRWQTYDNWLTATRTGTAYNTIAGFLGGKFPRIDRKEFDIVTSARTENAFKTKQDEAIKLTPAKEEAKAAPAPEQEAPTKGKVKKPVAKREIPGNVFVGAGGTPFPAKKQ